ncbi:hypothetical protein MY11210_002231 [Beauveria gryllotalpidicola]
MKAMKRAGGWFGMCVSGLGLSKAELFRGDYTPTYTFAEVTSEVKSQPDTPCEVSSWKDVTLG